jgi:geranylgeranyl pyrophosphate synthase
MLRDAVPGLAIPLLRNGCDATAVDLDWVLDVLRLRHDGERWVRCNVEPLRAEVGAWFAAAELRPLFAGGNSQTENMALEWVATAGKRWRPLLVAGTYEALAGRNAVWPDAVRKLAVAVECFHKASLIHDDIEDQDDTRYGEQTLHCRYGVPVALNVGDFLLGEGYRLIAASGASAEATARMLSVAAEGHRELCLGQGRELCWRRAPAPLTVAEALEIFRRKTAPAFDVALRLGAIAAGAGDALGAVLKEFSARLGTAYQVRDDLDDLDALRGANAAVAAHRISPSVLLALASDGGPASLRADLDACLQVAARSGAAPAALLRILGDRDVEAAARHLYEQQRELTHAALQPLRDVPLKCLLQRIAGRILPEDHSR